MAKVSPAVGRSSARRGRSALRVAIASTGLDNTLVVVFDSDQVPIFVEGSLTADKIVGLFLTVVFFVVGVSGM